MQAFVLALLHAQIWGRPVNLTSGCNGFIIYFFKHASMKCLCVHISVYNLITIKKMIKRVFLQGIVPGTYYNRFSSLSCGFKGKINSLGCERWQLELHTCPKPPNSNVAMYSVLKKRKKKSMRELNGFTSMKTFNI